MEPTPIKANQESRPRPAEILSQRVVERVAAALLILYVLASIVPIVVRMASGTPVDILLPIRDGTEPEMFALSHLRTMIWLNNPLYIASQTANLISSFILVSMSAVSYQVFQHHDRTLALMGAFMFLGAAFFTGLSAVGGLALAQEYGGPLPAQAPLIRAHSLLSTYNAIEPLRALAGRVGFTFAALGLLALSGLIAWSGALPRWLGWLGIVAGVLMFFIWNPDAAALHRIGGGAYLLWLLLLAGWLLFRGTHDATAGDIDAETGEH